LLPSLKEEEPMADRRRGESKQLKKDQTVRRETLEEIGSEIVQDRTGRRTDEDRSRDAEKDGDEGLGPASER
jgi:hypothetical protein